MLVLETQHKSIAWRWVVLVVILALPTSVALIAAGSLTFTMKKFIESPAIINAVSSLDVLFNILVAATCLYISDRIWTRFGRRKVFIVPAWVVMGLCLLALPLAGSTWSLVTIMVLWLIFVDVGSAFYTLQMEIVPPHQRGRMGAISAWLVQLLLMFWFLGIAGRFDDQIEVAGFTLQGEAAIYWLGAFCIFMAALFLGLYVKERKPVGELPHGFGGGPIGVVRELFADRKLWPVYLLGFSQILISTGLGAIDPLLITEQWGYAKQDMGTNIFVGGVINLLFIPVVGWLVDKMDRIKLFAVGVLGTLVAQVAYYVFVQFVLPDRRPEVGHIIVFGQLISMFGQFTTIAFAPLVYDYIPRDRMGTANAGNNLVRSLTRLLTLNGIGLWVAGYSSVFCPPGVYDYFSGYLFMILMNFLGCIFLLYFAIKVRRGAILPIGRTEFVPIEDAPKEEGRGA